MKDKKNILIGSGILVIILILILIYINRGNARVDYRDVECSKISIDSIELNTDKMECFKTKVSSCQKPTYSSMKECEKKNNIKK